MKLSVVLIAVGSSCVASAQTVDAVVEMNRLLAGKPAVCYSKGTPDRQVGMRHHGEDVWVPGIPASYGPARVVNSRILEVRDFTFAKDKAVGLPENMLINRKLLRNCAPVNTTSSTTLTVSGQKSWSITHSRTIATTTSANVSVNFKWGGLSGSGGVNWSQVLTVGTTATESGSETQTRTTSEVISIPPRTAIRVSYVAYEQSVDVPFRCTVIVDGDLAPNVSGVSQASQYLSVADRTFTIEGVLHAADVSDAQLNIEDAVGVEGCGPHEIVPITNLAGRSLPPGAVKAEPLAEEVSEISVRVPAAAVSDLIRKNAVPMNRFFNGDTQLLKHLKIENRDNPAKRFISVRPLDNEIVPPDGTHYRVLYTREVAEPSPACGFNDLGVANIGIFNIEAREYSTYAGGKLVSTWNEDVKLFVRCHNP